jgi:hypothetical protein
MTLQEKKAEMAHKILEQLNSPYMPGSGLRKSVQRGLTRLTLTELEQLDVMVSTARPEGS